MGDRPGGPQDRTTYEPGVRLRCLLDLRQHSGHETDGRLPSSYWSTARSLSSSNSTCWPGCPCSPWPEGPALVAPRASTPPLLRGCPTLHDWPASHPPHRPPLAVDRRNHHSSRTGWLFCRSPEDQRLHAPTRSTIPTGAVGPGAHPRRHTDCRLARHQPPKTKRSADGVGGPSRKIEASDTGGAEGSKPSRKLTVVSVVRIPVLFHFGEVIGRPCKKGQEWLIESAPERCDAVLHGNGTLLQHLTFDEAVAFQATQRLRQRLLRDPVNFSLEFVEASRLLAQRRQ